MTENQIADVPSGAPQNGREEALSTQLPGETVTVLMLLCTLGGSRWNTQPLAVFRACLLCQGPSPPSLLLVGCYSREWPGAGRVGRVGATGDFMVTWLSLHCTVRNQVSTEVRGSPGSHGWLMSVAPALDGIQNRCLFPSGMKEAGEKRGVLPEKL